MRHYKLHSSIHLASSISLLLLLSCTQSIVTTSVDNNVLPLGLSVRSSEVEVEADPTGFDISQRMVELFFSSNKSNLPIKDIEPYLHDGVICLYIVNFEKGFKIVSADTRVPPILAESEDGFLDLEKLDNDGMTVWLEDTANRISILKRHNAETGEDYSDLWSNFRSHKPEPKTRVFPGDSIWIRIVSSSLDTVNHVCVSPLLSTKWGQGYPWNTKMPLDQNNHRSVTGCVAVAVSQVLYYFNQSCNCPDDLYHQVNITNTIPVDGTSVMVVLSRSDYHSPSSRWSDMALDRYDSHTDYVSDLMLDIGGRLGMKYSATSSGVEPAYNYSIPNLTNCGISSSFSLYSRSLAETSILNETPVIVSAFLTHELFGGHTWVIDGCKGYTLRASSINTYYCIHPEELCLYSDIAEIYSYDEIYDAFPDAHSGMQDFLVNGNYQVMEWHMNWGFDGTNNDYYGVLDTSSWNYNSFDFKYCRTIHYNISASSLFL